MENEKFQDALIDLAQNSEALKAYVDETERWIIVGGFKDGKPVPEMAVSYDKDANSKVTRFEHSKE